MASTYWKINITMFLFKKHFVQVVRRSCKHFPTSEMVKSFRKSFYEIQFVNVKKALRKFQMFKTSQHTGRSWITQYCILKSICDFTKRQFVQKCKYVVNTSSRRRREGEVQAHQYTQDTSTQ